MKALLLSLAILVWFGGAQAREIDVAALEETVQVAHSEGFSGAVLIIVDDTVVLRTAVGSADDAAGIPATPETVFDLGSIAKPFTATAVMHLVRAERVGLGDTVEQYLSGVPRDKAGITIRQLLTHTACLPDQVAESDFEPINREEALRRIFAMRLQCTPGRRYAYSNAGYTLLAAIIETVAGRDYFDFMRQEVFAPAGLMHTGFYNDAALTSLPSARGYLNGEDQGVVTRFPGPYWPIAGNGEVLSTVDDMGVWARLLLAGDARALTLDELRHSSERLVRDGDVWAGLGWTLEDGPLGSSIRHNGGGAGGNSDFAIFPESRIAIIVLGNRITYRTVLGVPVSFRLPATALSRALEARLAQ